MHSRNHLGLSQQQQPSQALDLPSSSSHGAPHLAKKEAAWLDANEELDGARATTPKSSSKKPGGGFQHYNLPPFLFKGIMRMGFSVPTPVQRASIPALLQRKDVIMMARTGSGKTAAFLVPMLTHLTTCTATSLSSSGVSAQPIRALILSPTRELAEQTFHVTQQLIKFLPTNLCLRPCLLVGGSSLNAQFESLDHHPNILIATPGRLLHHLIEVGFSLRHVETLIYDEADRLLELGFAPQLSEIHKKLSAQHQTVLVSATMPQTLIAFTRQMLQDAYVVKLDQESQISPTLEIALCSCRESEKIAALLLALQMPAFQHPKTVLLFAATRHRVEFLHGILQAAHIDSAPVYGQLDPAARKINVAKFKASKVHVLIVTDVAARGIDLPFLDAVINFDFPSKPKLFVHRVGRVARAGRAGVALCLVSHQELPYMLDLQLFLARPFVVADASTVPSLSTETQNIIYGHLPTNQLAECGEQINFMMQDATLSRLHAVGQRSYQLYQKTRPPASNASAMRAKKLSSPQATHPWFLNAPLNSSALSSSTSDMDSNSIVDRSNPSKHDDATHRLAVDAADQMRRAISTYQARATIFEINGTERDHAVHSIRRQLQSKRAKDMPSNRAAPAVFNDEDSDSGGASDLIRSTPQQRSLLPSISAHAFNTEEKASYRDPVHWIGTQRGDAALEEGMSMESGASAALAQLSAASMDMLGDEANALLMQTRTRSVWDHKKRNYMKVTEGGDPFKAQRNEQGDLVRAKDQPALYEKWKKNKKSKADAKYRAAQQQDDDVDQHSDPSTAMIQRASFRGKSELKDASVVRKQRLQQEKRKFKQSFSSSKRKTTK